MSSNGSKYEMKMREIKERAQEFRNGSTYACSKEQNKFNVDKVIEEFEEITKNAGKIQDETLTKILEENAEAEYLQKLGVNGRIDVETFKQRIPLVTHKDLDPFMQRIMEGDNSPILTGRPLTQVSWSSGTTQGKPKFVPFNDALFRNTAQILQTSFAYRNRQFPIEEGKALNIIFGRKQFKTKGGIIAGTATTNVFRHPLYSSTVKSMQSQSCSPSEVIFGSDFHQSLYCHLLCGLLHNEEIQLVSSTFAHSLVQAFETFELVWEDLCSDIRDGVLNKRVTDSETRETMGKILKPNPELAEKIHEICSGLSEWHGLISALFPNVKYVYGIMTGAMEPYVARLRRYSGELPLVCADYGASEGWVAVNVHPSSPPESATFVVLPNIGYFEFIPLAESHNGGLEPKPVALTEVKIGQEYEIVVTNFGGLYRYRLGDVVKVMGFYNNTPELKFVRRHNLVLSITTDKNTEDNIQLVVEEANQLLLAEKVNLVDFTSRVDLSKKPGHYVICWELSGDANENVLQECCNSLDRAFTRDVAYLGSRKFGNIDPLELRILSKGTFEKILQHSLRMGATASQFKVPRCIASTNKALLDIVDNNVAKSYFSNVFG